MRLLQLVNLDSGVVTGGGSSRIRALDDFVDSHDGQRIVVQDWAWHRNRAYRLMRPLSLLRQVRLAKPDALILRYPGFPFFWSIEGNVALLRGLFFLNMLRRVKSRQRFGVAVDILDLLRYPSPNPDMKLELSDKWLGFFEQRLLDLADETWACSRAIGKHLAETYHISEDRVRVVLNGNFRHEASPDALPERIPEGGVRFFYAGDLAPGWRGTELMIDAFLSEAAQHDAWLILCGANGDWIRQSYPDQRVINLGVLSPSGVAAAGRQCQAGLIPQPEEGYYHLAFPTKLGLYLTLGLAVVTTRAREAAEFVEENGVGVVTSAEDLGKTLADIARDPDSLYKYRTKAAEMGEAFYWDNIYAKAFDGFEQRMEGTDGQLNE